MNNYNIVSAILLALIVEVGHNAIEPATHEQPHPADPEYMLPFAVGGAAVERYMTNQSNTDFSEFPAARRAGSQS